MSNNNCALRTIIKHHERYYIVHYSCQSLYDDNEGLSPRIAAIAVLHLSSKQMVSFSTHAIAEELKYKREQCAEHADEIEKKLLEDFAKFLSERRDKLWLHWNMKNLTYGFEHIEHRFRLLVGRDMPSLAVERRINIDDIIVERYGEEYISKPRMQKLMEKNGGIRRNFLNGPQEVEAFKSLEFSKMHSSTVSKVEFFKDVIQLMKKGQLKTDSNGIGLIRYLKVASQKLLA